MPNRYYLVDLGSLAERNARKAEMVAALPDDDKRVKPSDQLHIAESTDGRFWIAQAETSNQEHNAMTRQNWITVFSDLAAVEAYKSANAALWDPMR